MLLLGFAQTIRCDETHTFGRAEDISTTKFGRSRFELVESSVVIDQPSIDSAIICFTRP